ncbi:intermembrane phospholipid transport protein YdbH family protein [Rheinheimera fenheensis]|uniref:intermembrane phospholipid transport protein YdbH family protein n=1 Tax=Rheinheimera fenheensis TaxID=3152295 RepID=UPI003260EB37
MRRWHKALLIALAIVLLVLAVAYRYVQKTLAALPVQQVQYEISSLSLQGLTLSNLSFVISESDLQVTLDKLSLSWRFSDVKLTAVQLVGGDIRLNTWPASYNADASQTAETGGFIQSWQLPPVLPEAIQLEKLNLTLPCAGGACRYQLSGHSRVNNNTLDYKLELADADSPQQRRLSLSGSYSSERQLPQLSTQLQLDDSATLALRQQISTQQNTDISIDGELSLQIAPPSPWLRKQLELWQLPLPDDALAHFTAPVSVQSQWQLTLPSQQGLAALASAASGDWQLRAHLPSPFAVPGLGLLQGDLTAAVAITEGELNQYQLEANLNLTELSLPQALSQMGLETSKLILHVTSEGAAQLTALPLQFSLTTEGPTQVSLTASANLNATPPFSASLQNADLTVNQPQLNSELLQLDTVQLQSRFNAYWLADSWQLDLQQLTANVASATAQDATLQQLRFSSSHSRLSGDAAFSEIKLKASAELNIDNLQHSAIKPLAWQWQLSADGRLTELAINGRVSNSAGFGVAHQLAYTPDATKVNWQLDELFLLAGNPLAATLNDWPALLELNRGRLSGNGSVLLASQAEAQAKLTLSGVSGIYDRSLFKDASSTFFANYQDYKLTVSTEQSRVGEINHGIVAGPLLLSASYQAGADALSTGTLDIRQLQLSLMGGSVSLQPQQLKLADKEQLLQLELKQLELSQLLQQHPSTDVSGNGSLSGRIPLLLSSKGASVQQGVIAAESPGGQLQYRPAKAQSMAASNPGMKLVLEALDDFHYSVLSSNVSYDTSGKLLLALQLQGKNPALEQGRAINLNINLEEDIPALITSLQLSSQISDVIKKRVQQKLQQSGAKGANGAKL